MLSFKQPTVRAFSSDRTTATNTESPDPPDFGGRSTLYREFLAEREEILRHKWIESEKQGCDVGFEHALVDWIRNHRERWRATRRLPIC